MLIFYYSIDVRNTLKKIETFIIGIEWRICENNASMGTFKYLFLGKIVKHVDKP